MNPVTLLVVFTNFPDAETARRIARLLVEERLAACVNMLPAAESIYSWKSAVEQAQEIPAILKTTAAAWPALRDRLAALHPYEVPEIIALPAADGLPAYLEWVGQGTAGH